MRGVVNAQALMPPRPAAPPPLTLFVLQRELGSLDSITSLMELRLTTLRHLARRRTTSGICLLLQCRGLRLEEWKSLIERI